MSPRSIRRAAERNLRKLERKRTALSAKAACPNEAAILSEPKIQGNEAAILSEPKIQGNEAAIRSEPKIQDDHPAGRRAAKVARKAAVSEAQLAANRANAQLSTGPVSETGQRISSLNAVKTGLTGRTVLLSSDDAEMYGRHIAAYEAEYQPAGLRECELVQSLADTQWRLNRIPGLEAAIYALGRVEFQGVMEDEKIELETHMKYEKSLRNLQLQEARLLRRYQKEMAELRALQKERSSEVVPQAPQGVSRDYRLPAAEIGFEFSTVPDALPERCPSTSGGALAPPARTNELAA